VGPLYGPLLQNLEVLGKKPTPAGALCGPPFFILLQIPTHTLHSWRPSSPPPNVGPTIFLFSSQLVLFCSPHRYPPPRLSPAAGPASTSSPAAP
jgi:hypothetical protein